MPERLARPLRLRPDWHHHCYSVIGKDDILRGEAGHLTSMRQRDVRLRCLASTPSP